MLTVLAEDGLEAERAESRRQGRSGGSEQVVLPADRKRRDNRDDEQPIHTPSAPAQSPHGYDIP